MESEIVPIPRVSFGDLVPFGTDWVTASFWQDWYGIIPLLVGSILVSVVALLIAVPFGVSAAIYVSEVAARGEKSLIKPYIEFISAIPSVVLGFFGIAVGGPGGADSFSSLIPAVGAVFSRSASD